MSTDYCYIITIAFNVKDDNLLYVITFFEYCES